ncbi:hypothetical protein B2J88_07975 [Rhodococcus sp. SRB_17]|nr:hypothetical protein [Rhodococcus sp. SRB_17]
MTAPDRGLTDLLAAHLTELITDAPIPNYEEDDYNAGYVAALADLRESDALKLAVEQHTQGQTARVAELEATILRVNQLAAQLDREANASMTYREIRRAHAVRISNAIEVEQR